MPFLSSCGRQRPADRPNVLLISIDTLRRDALGLYESRSTCSPFLDQLARSATVFDSAIAQAPWTLPSHAAMLCSLYPSELDLGSFAKPTRIHENATTLAEAMRAEGYATFGAVAGGFLHSELGFDQGFQSYDEDGQNMAAIVDKALARIDATPRDQSFFGFLHTYEVHRYDPTQEDRAHYITVKDSTLAKLPERKVADQLQRNDNSDFLKALFPRDHLYARQLYDASIHSVDREIARLFDGLRVRGLLADTLVVITSDHGEEFWEHGRTGHGYNLYDENLRVPLLMKGPGLPAARIANQVRSIDIAPTIAALAHIAPGSSWLGEDLTKIVAGEKRDLPAFSESAHLPYKAIRYHNFKLVVSLRRPFRQLFDLNADPAEKNDVLATQPEIGKKLGDLLAGWIKECAAETRFRGAGEARLSNAANQEIAELGYAARGAAEPEGAQPWLRALERDPMAAINDDAPPK